MMDSEDQDLLVKRDENKDRYHFVYIIVFFTGIGTLIPWNFFITVNQYFIYKLAPNASYRNSTEHTQLQIKFENYLSLSSMVPLAIMNILNLFLRRYITPMKRFVFGVMIMFLTFIVTLVFTKIDTSSFIYGFFAITMISVAILNICSGLIQGSAMGIISMLPHKYIKGFMEGQAISGMLAAVANIITISLPNTNITSSALIYFIIALVFLLLAGVGFTRLGKLRFTKRYVLQSSLMDNDYYISPSSSMDCNYVSVSYNASLPSLGTRMSLKDKYRPLLRRTIWHGLTSLLSFLVTLSLFPAVISLIRSTESKTKWSDIYFVPVTCFLFFNIADYLGRFLCGIYRFPSSNYPKVLFFISLSRVVLIPLFFICNIQPKMLFFPTVLASDVYPIVLTWILGLTNGYFLTLALIYAPSRVEDNDKEAVGTLMSVYMCFGLALGVFVSFLFSFMFP